MSDLSDDQRSLVQLLARTSGNIDLETAARAELMARVREALTVELLQQCGDIPNEHVQWISSPKLAAVACDVVRDILYKPPKFD